MKLTTFRATTLVTALCLATTLTVTSCGKKDKAETTTETTKTETTAPATTGSSTTPAAGGTDKPLSAADKMKLTPVKTALTMANTAVKGGDMGKAKAQFEKVSGMWPMVSPMLKEKAGPAYPAIESGFNMVKTAMGSATPDKAKAGEGLTAAIKGISAVMEKK
ncbi:MAG: hypothetical protein RLZZ135_2446 [Cyanobacteriota bacterium]|jgi:hypothetical protein